MLKLQLEYYGTLAGFLPWHFCPYTDRYCFEDAIYNGHIIHRAKHPMYIWPKSPESTRPPYIKYRYDYRVCDDNHKFLSRPRRTAEYTMMAIDVR